MRVLLFSWEIEYLIISNSFPPLRINHKFPSHVEGERVTKNTEVVKFNSPQTFVLNYRTCVHGLPKSTEESEMLRNVQNTSDSKTAL